MLVDLYSLLIVVTRAKISGSIQYIHSGYYS